MIVGNVKAELEAVISIDVGGSDGQRDVVEAVIDTGYNGFLTLPYETISFLDLPWTDMQRVILADGSSQFCDVYEGRVIWNGHSIAVEIEAAETQPLVGMEMMEGYGLHIQVVGGGAVSLEPL